MNNLTQFRWWSLIVIAGFVLMTWAVIGFPMLGPLATPLDAATHATIIRAGLGLLALGLLCALLDGIIRAATTPANRR